jgi:transient receptor potential cation channel subfamily A member 1
LFYLFFFNYLYLIFFSVYYLTIKNDSIFSDQKISSTFISLLLSDQDYQLNTPLHLSTINNKENIVRALLLKNADVNIRNLENFTALDIACQKGQIHIVELLIEYNSPINDIHNKMPKNPIQVTWDLPIHFAAKNGDTKLLKILIDKGADIRKLNIKSQNILDIAIKKNRAEVVEYLISLENWKSIIQIDYTKYKQVQLLIEKIPEKALMLLDNLIVDAKDSVYDFSLIDPSFKEINSIESHPLFVITLKKHEELLEHEVVREIVKLKWKIVPRFVYYFNLSLYLVFLLLLTYQVAISIDLDELAISKNSNSTSNHYNTSENINLISSYNYQSQRKESSIFHLLACSLILLAFHLSKELFQFYHNGIRHFYALDNNLELLTYVFSLIFLIPLPTAIEFKQSYQEENLDVLNLKTSYQISISSFCVLCGWLVLVLFCQKLPKFGIYAVMFQRMLLNSLRFSPIFLIMLLGFTFSFSARSQQGHIFQNVNKTTLSIMDTLTMLIGEFNMDSLNIQESYAKRLTFFFFISLMCIMILNLLIGIAVGEIKLIFEEADVQRQSMKIKFVLKVQFMLFKIFQDDSLMRVKGQYNKTENKKKSKGNQIKTGMKKAFNVKTKSPQTLRLTSQERNTQIAIDRLEKAIRQNYDSLNDLVKKIRNDVEYLKSNLQNDKTNYTQYNFDLVRSRSRKITS